MTPFQCSSEFCELWGVDGDVIERLQFLNIVFLCVNVLY